MESFYSTESRDARFVRYAHDPQKMTFLGSSGICEVPRIKKPPITPITPIVFWHSQADHRLQAVRLKPVELATGSRMISIARTETAICANLRNLRFSSPPEMPGDG